MYAVEGLINALDTPWRLCTSSMDLQRHNAVQVVCLSTIGSPHGEKVRRWRHVQAVEEVFGHPLEYI